MALLKAIFSQSGRAQRVRIRVSTLDPFEVPDELIAMVGVEKRRCVHIFHIALQSGSTTKF